MENLKNVTNQKKEEEQNKTHKDTILWKAVW